MIERYGVFEDHPRVCGEQKDLGEVDGSNTGSPPRVRGTVTPFIHNMSDAGITPACAGNRTRAHSMDAGLEDHPRVCGEQRKVRNSHRPMAGSPPRVRGTAGLPRCG